MCPKVSPSVSDSLGTSLSPRVLFAWRVRRCPRVQRLRTRPGTTRDRCLAWTAQPRCKRCPPPDRESKCACPSSIRFWWRADARFRWSGTSSQQWKYQWNTCQSLIFGCKITNKWAKCKRKACFSFHFRARGISTKSKLRISENNTKEKRMFFILSSNWRSSERQLSYSYFFSKLLMSTSITSHKDLNSIYIAAHGELLSSSYCCPLYVRYLFGTCPLFYRTSTGHLPDMYRTCTGHV